MFSQTLAWYITEPWTNFPGQIMTLLSLALMFQSTVWYFQQIS